MTLTPDREQQILEKASVIPEELFKLPHVHTFFPGYKQKSGKSTEEPCLVVCVEKKVPKETLKSEDLVPETVGDAVPTDVIELPPITAHGWCGSNNEIPPKTLYPKGCDGHKYAPDGELFTDLPGGVSCGPSVEMETGTLGIMVKDKDTRRVVGLTCNHVAGLQAYYPGPRHKPKRYVITDDGYNFVITDPETDVSFTKAAFDDVEFPRLQSGNIYEFQIDTFLHDFYISAHPAGGGFEPYTSITISNSAGDIRYSNGKGTGQPAASAGEILAFINDPTEAADTLYYNSWVYPWVGNQFQYVFAGVPPCKSINYSKPGSDIEYMDGRLMTRHRSLRGEKMAYPSNVDYDTGKQVLLGAVQKAQPIYFQHPLNRMQPRNKIDAATIDLNSSQLQGKFSIIGLNERPIKTATAQNGKRVFKSGRTTGVTPSGASIVGGERITGTFNDCIITSTTATVNVNYCSQEQTVQKYAIFEECILYEIADEYFSDKGDSGSALMMEDTSDSNKLRLVGLHFAGGHSDMFLDGIPDQPLTSYGIACKIQNVFTALNLTTWEGTIVVADDSPCIKVDGLCYERREMAYVRPTHTDIDEEFKDCEECSND